MTESLKNIVIVGGGSAGWMTAAYLSKGLPDVKITLVESADIPTVGVGEATIASIHEYLDFLKLKEADWMPFCKATYKYTIRYNNWHALGDTYWHPFEKLAFISPHAHVGHSWYADFIKQKNASRDRLKFHEECFFSTEFVKKNLIPTVRLGNDYCQSFFVPADTGKAHEVFVPYAYHFDAGLFGEYLKQHVAKPNGVTQIIDDITAVHQDERGFIKGLETKSGKKITGDLFVDCTGFASLLLDKTLKEPFEFYAPYLPCDRALAIQLPYEDIADEMHPYTQATALSAGWVWKIPLTHRIGTGYVYCSAFKSDDEAEAEYREHIGAARVKDITVRKIKIRVGKHERVWVKNCVGIGLAAGFIEPLESTGLAFVHLTLAKLVAHLKDGFYNAGKVAAYNAYNKEVMNEARDFLTVHYALTSREDSAFWQHCKYDLKLSEFAQGELLTYQQRLPNQLRRIIFGDYSWACILIGMNYLPEATQYNTLDVEELKKNLAFLTRLKNLRLANRGQFVLQSEFVKTKFS